MFCMQVYLQLESLHQLTIGVGGDKALKLNESCIVSSLVLMEDILIVLLNIFQYNGASTGLISRCSDDVTLWFQHMYAAMVYSVKVVKLVGISLILFMSMT